VSTPASTEAVTQNPDIYFVGVELAWSGASKGSDTTRTIEVFGCGRKYSLSFRAFDIHTQAPFVAIRM
jgi:hypothetical protein